MLLNNIIIALISLQLIAGQTSNKQCSKGIKVRKNIMDFSSEELKNWLEAASKFSKTSKFNEWAKIHYDNRKTIHGTELFLPWHRKFIAIYEEELLKFDSSVILPFIDWTEHSSRPHEHPVLQSNMYGGNGNKNNNWCLENGVFANLTISYPTQKCLQRRYNKNKNTVLWDFSSKEEVQSIIDRSENYSDFRKSIESNPHSQPHCYIADYQFDFYVQYSPSDPIFYLHHSYIDNIWYQWQSKNETRFKEYNSSDGEVSANDELVALEGIVADVLDPRQGSLCYKYDYWGTSIEKHLENSPAIQDNQSTRSLNRNESIWDKIKTLPFDKKTDKIPNIKPFSSRSSKCLIPNPGKLSPDIVKMRGLNPAQYEADRILNVKVINILNANPSYIPTKGC